MSAKLLPSDPNKRSILAQLNDSLESATNLYASVCFWSIGPGVLSYHLERVLAQPVPLSLTNFLNFVTKTGIQKLRFVEQLKRDEQFDFYGPLRDHVKHVHKTDEPKKELETVLQGLTNKQKAKCYPPVVKGYQKFWGRKKLEWIQPPKTIWQHANIVVNVAPELGLVIDGEVHVLKLYFRQ